MALANLRWRGAVIDDPLIGGNMAPRARLRLTLLGGFALLRGSQRVPVTVGGQRLIALLALRDGPVGRLHVAETLWPSCSAERSLASLRTTLWRVSQTAEEVIVARPAVLGLAGGIDVDVRHLATASHRLNQCRGPGTIDLDAVSRPTWSVSCSRTGMTTGCRKNARVCARLGCTRSSAWPRC